MLSGFAQLQLLIRDMKHNNIIIWLKCTLWYKWRMSFQGWNYWNKPLVELKDLTAALPKPWGVIGVPTGTSGVT